MAYALCLFCFASCIVQSLLPQGKMKQMAVFACGILFAALFLESGVQLLQSTDLSAWLVKTTVQQKEIFSTPSDVSARQIVKSVLGEEVECTVHYGEDGQATEIIIGRAETKISLQGKQGIKQALCGIYGIEETAIVFCERGG